MDTETLNEAPLAASTQSVPSASERAGGVMADFKARGDSGASWFYYIAALSLLNTAVIHLDGDRTFVIGLAITVVVDAVAKVIGNNDPQVATIAVAMAICFSVFVSGIAVLFGWFSRKRYLWVFGTGMVIYLLDGLLYLLIGELLSAGFHGYVLYGMYRGMRSYQQLRRLEEAIAQSTGQPD